MRKSHLTGAVMAIAIAAILFVVAIFLPEPHPLLSFAAVGATIGTLVLLWAAHRRVRYLAVYFGSIVMSVVLADRKSTRLNSSHQIISYAVFCLKKKT